MSKQKPALIARFLFFVNNLVALLTWAAYLAWFINPSKLPEAGMLALAVPGLIAANLLFILVWLVFYRRYILVSLLTVALGWWHISGLVAINISSKSETQSDKIRVMTYNVRSFHFPGPYVWHNTPPGITKMLDSLKPDILCMQEYLHGDNWLPDFNHPHKFIASKKEMSLAIYSNYPIISSNEVLYEQRAGEYNGFIYADIILNTDTVRVVNVHLMSIGINSEDLNKIKQLENSIDEAYQNSGKRLYRQLMRAYQIRGNQANRVKTFMNESPYPVLLCGDFNDTPTTYTYRVLSKDMFDAFNKAGNGFGTSHVKFSNNHLPLRIDHILIDGTFSSIHAEVVHQIFSDHYPIYADLELKD